MFGFGNKNKKQDSSSDLEFITMEEALKNPSSGTLFDKKTATAVPIPEKIETPKNQISKQLKEQITDEKKQEKRFFRKKSPTKAIIQKKPVTVSPFLENDIFAQDAINTKTLKAKKVQVPIEKSIKREIPGQDSLEPKKGLLIDQLLQKEPFPEEIALSTDQSQKDLQSPEESRGSIAEMEKIQTLELGKDDYTQDKLQPEEKIRKITPIIKNNPSEEETAFPLPEELSFEKKEPPLSSELQEKETIPIAPSEKKETLQRNPLTKDSRIHPEKKFSKLLLFFALITLLLTISGGLYYYFFILKQTQTNWTPIKLPSILDSAKNPQTTQEESAKILEKASIRSLNESSFQQELRQLLTALKADLDKQQDLENGIFLKFVSGKNIPYSTTQLLPLMEINNEAITLVADQNTWVFLVLENEDTLAKQSKTLKVNLLMELKKGMQNSQIVATLTESEENFPSQLASLFVDEEKPVIPTTISFKRSFTQSEIAPQTRYFNYEEGNGKKSIDWGIVTKDNKDYLMISTSKNSTQKMLQTLQQ